MTTVADILNFVETLAPRELKMDWDNVGLNCGRRSAPTCNYSAYSDLSKVVLSVAMLAGRLEIFPILVLFAGSTWKRK